MHLNFLSWLFLFLIANFLKMVHFFNFHFCCLSIIFNLKINMHKHLCSVQFSHSVMSGSLQPHGPQHARLPYPSPTPGAHPNPCPWSRWCHPTISFSVIPSPPALNFSQPQGLFKWVSSLYQVAKVLEFQLQHQSLQWAPRTDLL